MTEKCSLCNDVTAFHPGVKGTRADETKILFVLHKPDSRILEPSLSGLGLDPYESALHESQTGQEISRLLKYAELSWEDVFLTNIFKCAQERDRTPTVKEYQTCYKGVFVPQAQEFAPRAIVAFGKQVQRLMFPEVKTKGEKDLWGKILIYNSIPDLRAPTLIMPHPSRLWALRNRAKQLPYYQAFASFLNAFQ